LKLEEEIKKLNQNIEKFSSERIVLENELSEKIKEKYIKDIENMYLKINDLQKVIENLEKTIALKDKLILEEKNKVIKMEEELNEKIKIYEEEIKIKKEELKEKERELNERRIELEREYSLKNKEIENLKAELIKAINIYKKNMGSER
jgi:hypothetical protein